MHSSRKTPPLSSRFSLLAIDTAFDICSVALITPDLSDIRLSKQSRKHADEVLPMIEDILSSHSLQLDSLEGLAMVSGPGSFTGLRIGTAAVQGLAFGANLPVVCISSLAMMARSARHINGFDGLILSCFHARENEFYFAAYHDDLTDSPQVLVADTIYTDCQIRQCINHLLPDSGNSPLSKTTLAGSGWQHALLADFSNDPGFKTVTVATDALVLAELAEQDYGAGRARDASDATPVYLKDDMEYRTV